MKQYAILDVTDGIELVQDGDTREESIANLSEVAEVGRTYIEVRQLGSPIVPRERKAVTLTRVKPADAPVEPEATEGDPAPATRRRGGSNAEEE